MKEATEKLLKLAGFGAETINALKADELPEDFDIEATVQGYKQKRKDLILNDSDLMKELKQKHNAEQFPAIVKPLIKAVRDAGGFTSEEMEAFKEEGDKHPSLKKAISALSQKLKASGNKSQEEAMQKYFDVRKEYEAFKENSKNQIEELKTSHANQMKRGAIKRNFNKLLSGLDLVIPQDGAETLLFTDIDNAYKMDLTESGELMILNKDGSKVADDNNFLSAVDVVKGRAETFQIIRKSNGGGGDGGQNGQNGGNGQKHVQNNGKLSGKAAEMEKRAQERNKR